MEKYKKLIGKEVEIEGCVLSYNNNLPPTKFTVLKIRRGTSKIMNMKTMKITYATVQLLLKNDSMKRAQWSKPFPDYDTPLNSEL